MKASRFLFLFTCLAGMIFFLGACEKNDTDLNAVESRASEVHLKSNSKVDVCHKGRIINISSNAVPAHQRHGDAIDADGDGYFDADNSCGPTDCDDTDPEITAGPDGDCDGASVLDLIPGTWVTSDIAYEMTVGPLSALDYLTDVVGLTAEEAADRIAALEATLNIELEVTLIFYADNTYDSSFAGGSDSGTWILNEDETMLTLFEGPDTMVINLVSVTETTFVGILSDVIPFDLDGDPGSPDEDVFVEATVTLTRS